MPSVTASVGELLSSITTAIASIFTGIIALFQNALNVVFGILSTLFSAVGTTVAGLAQTFEGLLKFLLSEFSVGNSIGDVLRHWGIGDVQNANGGAILGNVLIIGLVLAAVFIYAIYQQRGGKPIAAKKTA